VAGVNLQSVRYFSSVHFEALVKKLKDSILSSSCLWVSGMILQQKLAQMLSRLTKIAEEFNVAVYITNQGELFCLALYLFQEVIIMSFKS
jgi:hypothetical protein